MNHDASTIQQEGRAFTLGSETQSNSGKPQEGPPRFSEETLARFWGKVNKDGPIVREELGACWQWTGDRLKGYGRFKVARKDERAHRISIQIAGALAHLRIVIVQRRATPAKHTVIADIN